MRRAEGPSRLKPLQQTLADDDNQKAGADTVSIDEGLCRFGPTAATQLERADLVNDDQLRPLPECLRKCVSTELKALLMEAEPAHALRAGARRVGQQRIHTARKIVDVLRGAACVRA